ncbi:MAG: glycosyl hydrolase 115 family protein, partial [Bacteroidales bacterium]|nr:glycosyl hydrolase 115 family protein [Bacteroidales bacterium]
MIRKLTSFLTLAMALCSVPSLQAADTFVNFSQSTNPTSQGIKLQAGKIVFDDNEYPGVIRAINNLRTDMKAVCGEELRVTVGSIDKSKTIQQLIKSKKIDGKALKGKTEKFIITIMNDGEVVIAGSDKRGTIYGIYELSRQLGVSPWYWWADMPVARHNEIFVTPGSYTDGEPGVRYRGIFLNDEAPCLSNWVKEKFPDADCPSANPELARGFNHHFYEKVFELLLRLKANYMWPAMWGNAFYADDTENSALANEMGIIMGTSHHEPMARNHQEWARHRNENGPWDYAKNQKVIDDFFREGIRRSKDNEDIITIGMRGDGDAAMGGEEGNDEGFVPNDAYYISLYEKIFKNQRQIIKEETGKPAEKRTQLWALYKEVQHYYDLGLTVPDDVIILLCDDNWGNIRRVPAKPHKGGFGMYYHVDYVGAPRSSKWANITPIAHLWEQMSLCVNYGIDKLWILNVGDLKPMEYPIDFFLEMAWDPKKFEQPSAIRQHTLRFTEQMVPENEAAEAARILEKYTMFNGRVTPEMLNAYTYNLQSGEWAKVVGEYKQLELDAVYQYNRLPQSSRDTYHQLLLYPVQSMANLYEMYYELAKGNQEGVDRCFERDSLLTIEYHNINGGKWNHLMREIHIGYRAWNTPPRNIKPIVAEDRRRKAQAGQAAKFVAQPEEHGGYIFKLDNNQIVMEAEHYYTFENSKNGQWTVIPAMGRTLSAIELLPHNADQTG